MSDAGWKVYSVYVGLLIGWTVFTTVLTVLTRLGHRRGKR